MVPSGEKEGCSNKTVVDILILAVQVYIDFIGGSISVFLFVRRIGSIRFLLPLILCRYFPEGIVFEIVVF